MVVTFILRHRLPFVESFHVVASFSGSSLLVVMEMIQLLSTVQTLSTDEGHKMGLKAPEIRVSGPCAKNSLSNYYFQRHHQDFLKNMHNLIVL